MEDEAAKEDFDALDDIGDIDETGEGVEEIEEEGATPVASCLLYTSTLPTTPYV